MKFSTNQIGRNRYFQDLMLHRVHEILLVASPYDAYTLDEDGRLTEQILHEYLGMNLSYAPRVWQANTAFYAMDLLSRRPIDLIIVMLRISDMDPITFGAKVKELYSNKPIILLAFDESEIKQLPDNIDDVIDHVFVWTGDSSVFPAIIKCIEDMKNVKRDVRIGNVRAILFIEDVDENLYSFDRMLVHMGEAGMFDNIRGLIVGQLTEMKDQTIPFGKTTDEIVLDVCGDLNIPIVTNFPCGHGKYQATLPISLPVELRADKNFVVLLFFSLNIHLRMLEYLFIPNNLCGIWYKADINISKEILY